MNPFAAWLAFQVLAIAGCGCDSNIYRKVIGRGGIVGDGF
jgi:hypothetical protein